VHHHKLNKLKLLEKNSNFPLNILAHPIIKSWLRPCTQRSISKSRGHLLPGTSRGVGPLAVGDRRLLRPQRRMPLSLSPSCRRPPAPEWDAASPPSTAGVPRTMAWCPPPCHHCPKRQSSALQPQPGTRKTPPLVPQLTRCLNVAPPSSASPPQSLPPRIADGEGRDRGS
jgi:hypothetical protein